MTEQPGASDADVQELADARERDADELARRSEELQAQVNDARNDWARKRADAAVPGAPAPDDAFGPSSDGDAAGPDSPTGKHGRDSDD